MSGGVGQRLRPLTQSLPKPMAPVCNRPILEHMIALLKQHGYNEIILLLYYLPAAIRDYLGDGRRFGVNLRYMAADKDYGTAGAVRLVAESLSETFLVLSGDLLTNLNLSEFTAFHAARTALATLALAPVVNPEPFGNVTLSEDARITRFVEKPSHRKDRSSLVNAGIYLLEPDIFDFIPQDEEYLFARDLFPRLVAEGLSPSGFVGDSYWRDLGTPEAYLQGNLDVRLGRFRTPLQPPQQESDFCGPGCRIATNVHLKNSVLGRNCRIGQGTIIRNSVLWDDVTIGQQCHLEHCVVAGSVTIGERVKLQTNVTIGEGAVIADDAIVPSGSRINPEVRPG